jgi:hypothetical protein
VKAHNDWARRLNELDSEFQLMIVRQLDYRRQLRESRKGKPKGFYYNGMEDYLLRHGVWYSPEPWREEWERGPKNACYAHSLHCCLSHPELRYVEGVAVLRNIPVVVNHAWVMDRDGRLIDGIWANEGTAYLGCTFPLSMVAEVGGVPLFDYPLKSEAVYRTRREKERP